MSISKFTTNKLIPEVATDPVIEILIFECDSGRGRKPGDLLKK
jgi:hypothetical protein